MAEASVAEAPARTGPETGRSLSGWPPRPWLFPLLVFAGTWIMFGSAVLVSNAVSGHSLPWIHYFFLWDSKWYAAIASGGYGHPRSVLPATSVSIRGAFFPLYPLTVKAVMLVIGNHVDKAALIVQFLAGAASATAVWALARKVYGDRVADRAVLLYCAFPGGTELGWFYSDPLGIALGASCLLAVLGRRWAVAGVLAMLASAEHSTYIVLCPVLGIVALREIRLRGDWRSLVAPVLAPLGLLAFFASVGHQYHDYLFWFQAEHAGWHEHMDFGLHTLSLVTGVNPVVWQTPFFYVTQAVLFWIAVVAVVLLIRARAPLAVTLFTALALAMCFLSQVGPRPRFVFSLVGIYLIYAARLPKWAFWPALIVSAALEAFLYGYWPHTVHRHHTFPYP